MKASFVKFTQTHQIGQGYPPIVMHEVINLAAIARVVRHEEGDPLIGKLNHEVTCLDVWFAYSEHPLHFSGRIAEWLWTLLQEEAIELSNLEGLA